ncbi:MAG: peptidyl-prolyl cis-trans isomerase [Desulfobacteria bacterium]
MRRSPIVSAWIVIPFAIAVLGGCRTEPAENRVPAQGIPAASVSDNGSSGSPGSSAPSSLSTAVLSVPEGYPYKEKPIYAVGSRPVTEEELQRFSRRMLGAEEHGKNPGFAPEKMIQTFARYWIVVEMGIERGMPDTPGVRNVVDVYRHAALANDYRVRIEKTLPVPDEAIRASIPPDWTRMEFSVVTFPDPKDADNFAREVQQKKKTLPKAGFAKFVDEKFKSRTGKIFRGSGFFVESEEPYLFSLKEGEISRAVDTGIGKGVCYAYSREFLDGKAREEYVEQAREMVREQEMQARFKSIVDKARYTVHRDNVAEAVQIEGRTGMQPDLTVLTLKEPGGGIALTYRDFRSLTAGNYTVNFKLLPPESWINAVLPDVENLANLYAVGTAAAREKIALDPRWGREMFDFRGKTIYLATLDRLAMETTPKVTDQEVERFYKTNRGFFDRKETARIRYVYAPERKALESLIKQAGSRQNIFTKKEYADLVKGRVVTRDDMTFGDLFKALEGVNAGTISGVVKAGMGYYIAKVEERRPKGFLPLKEVREQIRRNLLNEKRQEKVRETVNARMASVPIRKL